ncbi:MAG: DNA polymerase I, partial [Spirochaetes bacterium]|nr:DNA polymerase I [Spirochaetota bacterium]
MKKTLYVIDGFGVIFRAYYAFINRPLVNSRGENTSAVFGFFRMIFKIIKEYKPENLVIALDSRGDTFRHKMYPDYKANRNKTPEDLLAQIPWIIELIEMLGIPSIAVDTYEADDIIAQLAVDCDKKGYNCSIFSGDKDLLQLINKNVNILTTKHGSSDIISFDKEAVYEKFGINPDQVADYLSIVGDASDNVPGVKGIGKKGAEKLLNNYANLDEIYSAIDEIKPDGIRNKLRDSKDSAYLSRDLVLLNREMDLPLDEAGWTFNGLNSEAAMERLLELELKILMSDPLLKTAGQAVPVKEAAPLKYHLVNTKSDLDMLLSKLKKCDKFAVDTETTSLDTLEAELLGISFSFEEGIGYYLPVGHSGPGIDPDAALKRVSPYLADPSIGKIGQNLKYDASVFASLGISFKGIIFDSMIAAYLLSPGLGRYKLEELALRYLGREMIHYSDLVDDKEKTLFDVSIEKVAEYAAEDAEVALCLYNKLMPMLQETGMKKLFEEIEVPLIEVLSDMERQGLAIDNGHFQSLGISLEKKIKKLESDIY